MESQPQNPEFRKIPENFHPCVRMFFWVEPAVSHEVKEKWSWVRVQNVQNPELSKL